MPTFITPPGYSGSAELTASNGLNIISQGLWRFSQAGYNDSATFGLGLGTPHPIEGGELHLRAENWPIAVIGNELTSYTDPDTSITYPASQCRIVVTGNWQVLRQVNSNSWNSVGVLYTATTTTDQGDRSMNPWLLNYVPQPVTYVKQGADVDGGAIDTFSSHVFECRAVERIDTNNSNRECQSNTTIRPVWQYTYSKSWQTAP